jgi:transcriptional regulator with XRE-family HTH domain
MNNNMSLADLLKERRLRLGLKQQQIAEELRVGPECVGLWERGKRRPELDKLPRLAAALRLDEQDVCRLALFESHPCLYSTIFGDEPPCPPRPAA